MDINTSFSIDATNNTSRLCRYVNDEISGSLKNNAIMKLKIIDHIPRLCLFAARNISSGEEVRYDYMDADALWRQVYCEFK